MGGYYVIVLTPLQTREYGDPEVIGPFDSEDEAKDHLALHLEVGADWEANVVRIEHPSEER